MEISDLLKYKFTCIVSSEHKEDPTYTDKKFVVDIHADENSDSGYIATIELYDGEIIEEDGANAIHHISFGEWLINNKEKK